MAENVLETRILLRYGTYSQWMNSNVILKVGEAAVAAFPRDRIIDGLSNSRPENTPPAIGIKIGDGQHYFSELPWIQAIAADVYNWAKQSVKPTYTAQEISGLQNYIENLIGGDTDVTIAPRIYQLVEGTDADAGKYYLRYKENNEESEWILDTSTYIDISDIQAILKWLDLPFEDFPNLATFVSYQAGVLIDKLVYTDQEREHYFVTSVSEDKGVISVTKDRPDFSDLTGAATVEQGGTGRKTLTEDNVLVGNGTDPVRLIPIADTIAANNALVPNYVIKSYVDNAVAGLTGAMHFIGEAGVVITANSNTDPRIPGYSLTDAQPGDVILYDSKEFVWTGTQWRLLGDEGSYAVKGSIRDADIDPDAAIQQSKIANLAETFDTKVDKVEGKSLTSNDFTDELKQKLDEIEDGAQRNTIEHIFLNDEEVRPTTVQNVDNAIDLQIQEFDDNAQQKLASIEPEAQVNKIEKIKYDGEEIIPDENKVVNIISDPHTEHENKIEQIFINGVEWVPNADKQVKIIIDQAALNLNVLEGATIPGTNGREDVEQVQKKLILERIAVSGNVKDLLQTADTYITLDCGSSTEVI